MNEVQIQTLLINNPVTRPYFGGVVAYDELPLLTLEHPVFYVVNTDSRSGVGKHWTVIFLDNHVEFFDSLGKNVDCYADTFKQFLTVNGPWYMYCCTRLQSFNSKVCGEFCLYFAYYRCLGLPFKDIINKFTSNLNNNDLKVDLFKKYLSTFV